MKIKRIRKVDGRGRGYATTTAVTDTVTSKIPMFMGMQSDGKRKSEITDLNSQRLGKPIRYSYRRMKT